MSNLPAEVKALLASFEQAEQRQELSEAGSGHYLKLDRSGVWQYGSDETEVEPASRWAINSSTLATGFAAWDDTEKVGEEMALLVDTPILKSSLPDVGAPWRPQTAMQLKCMDGEDEGVEVLYSTTSVGGIKAFNEVRRSIKARLSAGEASIIPIVEMNTDSYKHKKYGKIYTPELKIVDWMGLNDLAPTAKEELPEDKPEAPKEEETPEAAPARRRRKRA